MLVYFLVRKKKNDAHNVVRQIPEPWKDVKKRRRDFHFFARLRIFYRNPSAAVKKNRRQLQTFFFIISIIFPIIARQHGPFNNILAISYLCIMYSQIDSNAILSQYGAITLNKSTQVLKTIISISFLERETRKKVYNWVLWLHRRLDAPFYTTSQVFFQNQIFTESKEILRFYLSYNEKQCYNFILFVI